MMILIRLVVLFAVTVGAAFVYERDYAVNSEPIQARITDVRNIPGDGRSRPVYFFEYSLPNHEGALRGQIDENPWYENFEGRPQIGEVRTLRRGVEPPHRVAYGEWYLLYLITLGITAIFVTAGASIVIKTLRGHL